MKQLPDYKVNLDTCKIELLGKKPSHEAEDWLVSHVCHYDERNALVVLSRNFFLDEFSRPFLESLSQHLYGRGAGELMGAYFDFISPVGGESKRPYYKVYCFSRKRDSKLRSYIATITARHFTNVRAKELAKERMETSIDASDRIKSNFWESDLKENEWFSLLLSEDRSESDSVHDKMILSRLEKAMNKLPERERKVLQLTVMDNLTGLEAFEELAGFMNSKRDQSKMEAKDKQKAVAVLKFQAIAHLRKLMHV
ncbi:RNA polymerase sigma factor [uncultured Duncaniella sp.]|uniref:RNA polymerase sigma factor n=1 Tax=uncultured Duncaniella sp. TaxID=2768039 RepID=UPI002711EAF8|nr:hypothetical protein [uncultured Duncaniella sp.]